MPQLAAPHRREQIAHPIVVADFRVLVMRCRIPRLRREFQRMLQQLGILRDQHPTPGGGDDLVAVEREEPGPPQGARLPPLVRRAERFSRVFDDGNVVLGADVENGIHVGALAVQVHHDDRFGEPPLLCRGGERLRQELGIHVPRRPLAVDEDGTRAEVANGIDGSGEGQRADEDVVTGRDTEMQQRQMQRGGTGIQRQRRRAADRAREFILKRFDVRAERRDPVTRERVDDEIHLFAAHVRRRQVDARECGRCGGEDRRCGDEAESHGKSLL